MRRLTTVAAAFVGALAFAATAAAEQQHPSCNGTLSAFTGQLGVRDDIARSFAANLHPAGQNAYSEAAKEHAGSVAACLAP